MWLAFFSVAVICISVVTDGYGIQNVVTTFSLLAVYIAAVILLLRLPK